MLPQPLPCRGILARRRSHASRPSARARRALAAGWTARMHKVLVRSKYIPGIPPRTGYAGKMMSYSMKLKFQMGSVPKAGASQCPPPRRWAARAVVGAVEAPVEAARPPQQRSARKEKCCSEFGPVEEPEEEGSRQSSSHASCPAEWPRPPYHRQIVSQVSCPHPPGEKRGGGKAFASRRPSGRGAPGSVRHSAAFPRALPRGM